MQIVVGDGGEFSAELNETTDERQLQTKTGQDGRFTFAELPLNIDASVRARPEKLCDVVKPAAIEKAGVMDLGDLIAVPGGSIAGTVLGPTGAPVKNCTVGTWAHDGNSPAGFIRIRGMKDADTRSATTNASGQYRIDGVPEGECSVGVTSEEHPNDTRNGVRVRTNEVTWETDFKLATGASIAGVVRDSEGHPMAGVPVTASPSEMFIDLAEGSGQSARKATTGADGRFVLQGLRAEPCNVRARKPGFVPAAQRQVTPGTDVALTLRPCGVAWGHVRNAVTNEPVNEFTMRLVKDMPLDARGRARVLRGAEAAKAAQVPESPGLFAVVDLPDSPMQVRVQATDFADAQIGPFRAPPGEKTEVKVLLNPQAMIKGTVVDATGAPVEGARINFTNAKSEPTIVEGGMRYRTARRVVARRDTPEQAEEPVVSRAVTSGADGSFVIKGLPGGTFRLTASRRGFAGSPPSEVAVKPSGLADGVRLVLEMGGTFAGRALDPDGHPLAGARISLRPKEEDSEHLPDNARSGAGGEFEFTGLRPGDYFASLGDDVGEVSIQVSFTTGGPRTDDVPVTVEAGKTVRKDLQQKARASLSGIVKEGGKPAPGIKVTLVAAGLPEFFGGTSTKTDENGAFLLDKVASGDYSLIVDPPGGALPTRKSVALAPRAEQRITIDLPTGAIEGRITDKATGKPVAGITVTPTIEEGGGEQAQVTRAIMMTAIEDDDAGSISSITLGGVSQPIRTDSDGRYRLKYLSPAKYRVSIKGEGIMPQSRSGLIVETDKTTKEVDFGIEKGATLLVSIDPAGHDVTQVFGFVTQEGGSDSHDVGSGTVKNGVKFAGLKPGRYHVRIDAPMNDLEGTGDIDVTAGQEARLTVRLQQRE
jgi:protocatechuate 3,4-dioxygenase beta subunit